MIPIIVRYIEGEHLALLPTLPGGDSEYTCQAYSAGGAYSIVDPMFVISKSYPVVNDDPASISLLEELKALYPDEELKLIRQYDRRWLIVRREAMEGKT